MSFLHSSKISSYVTLIDHKQSQKLKACRLMKSAGSNVYRSLHTRTHAPTHTRIYIYNKNIGGVLTRPIDNRDYYLFFLCLSSESPCLAFSLFLSHSFYLSCFIITSSLPFSFYLLSILLPAFSLTYFVFFFEVYFFPCSIKHWDNNGHCKWVNK